MTTEERRRRRFTESFRKEQVAKIDSGELTIPDVCRLYEVKYKSVKRWVTKFGTKKLPGTIVVSSTSEVDKVKRLEKEIESLKKLIGELHIQSVYQQGVIEFAKQKLGEDFEKKS